MTAQRDAVTHALLTDNEPFQAVWQGLKTFEYRKDDRAAGYQLGDRLKLRETEAGEFGAKRYTGREILARVTYILRGPAYRIPRGFAVMAIDVEWREERGPEGEVLTPAP